MTAIVIDDHEEQAALQWLAGKTEAYPPNSASDEWLTSLSDLLLRAVNRRASYSAPACSWQLVVDSGRVRLVPARENPGQVRQVFFPVHADQVRIRTLARLEWEGVEKAWFFEIDGWRQWDLRALLVARGLLCVANLRRLPIARWCGLRSLDARASMGRLAMTLSGRAGPPHSRHDVAGVHAEDVWPRWMNSDGCPLHEHRPSGQPLKVVHYIGALFSGGAERQLCNVAIGQAQRGLNVRVATTHPCTEGKAHYAPLLHSEKITLETPTDRRGTGLRTAPWFLLQYLPIDIRGHVLALASSLVNDPPDVLHCWLDEPNIVGAIAGHLAGIPLIVLSTRNANPSHFPRYNCPYYRYWYQVAAQSPRVHFIANSYRGAASYAEWMSIPIERFHIVFNGIRLDHFPEATPKARLDARAKLGVMRDTPVICGVFRLAAEKRPHIFLEVVRRVKKRVPDLQVLLSGEGDLADKVANEVKSANMAGYTRLLGRRPDVATVYLASDVGLLTSEQEGCPNVALESQFLGVPMVATDAGGSESAVSHGVTGFIAGIDDLDSLTSYLIQVLTDHSLRTRLAAAGPAFIDSRFGLEQMIINTHRVYETALRGSQPLPSMSDRIAA